MDNQNKKRIIIDCDPGNGIPGSDVDDGLALALAVQHSDTVKTEMITVVAGNTSVVDGYSVARDFVGRLSLDIPVYAGAAHALFEDQEVWIRRRKREGMPAEVMNQWDNVQRPQEFHAPAGDDAVGKIIEAVAASPGEITIIAVGPLTNIAMALQRRPELADEVAEIIIMGGSFDVPGYLQELNVAVDPEAADFVMGSGAPITLVPLDVTTKTNLHPDVLKEWATFGTDVAEYVVETTRPWLVLAGFRKGSPGCYLHDPLAVAYFLDRTVGKTEEFIVGVETTGRYTRGRAIRWQSHDLRLADGLTLPERKPINVMVSVDNDRLIEIMSETFRRK